MARTSNEHYPGALDRRRFLSKVGKGLGLAALSSSVVASLLKDVHAAAKRVSHLSAEEAARDEDFWFEIQQSFSVTRGIVNLNNGGVSPSPRSHRSARPIHLAAGGRDGLHDVGNP
jgi:hypothetical protein